MNLIFEITYHKCFLLDIKSISLYIFGSFVRNFCWLALCFAPEILFLPVIFLNLAPFCILFPEAQLNYIYSDYFEFNKIILQLKYMPQGQNSFFHLNGNSELNFQVLFRLYKSVSKTQNPPTKDELQHLNKYLPNPITECPRTLDFKYPKTPKDQSTDIIIAFGNAF